MFRMMLKIVVLLLSALSVDSSIGRCSRSAVSSCMLAPNSVEGPYYWNTTLRRDIKEGRPGIGLRLLVTVLDTSTCSPLANAVVDLWHCDAQGIYSHFVAASLGQNNAQTDNSTFFRGQQVTDEQGKVTFDTVFPGWYSGRTIHYHIKVHVGASLTNINGALVAKGGHVSHVGQLYFNDSIADQAARMAPYTNNRNQRTRNDQDGIYSRLRGSTMLIPVRYLTNRGLSGGVESEVILGIDPKAVVNTQMPGPNGMRPPMSTSSARGRPTT